MFCQKIAKEAISHFDDEEDEEGELEFEFCDSSNSSCIAIVDKIYDYLEKYRYEDLPSYIQVCRGVKMCENSLMKQVSFVVVVVIVVVIYICCLGVETWRTVNNNNHFPSIFSCLLCLPLLINKLLSDTRVCGYRRHLELELDFRNRQEIYRDWLDSL